MKAPSLLLFLLALLVPLSAARSEEPMHPRKRFQDHEERIAELEQRLDALARILVELAGRRRRGPDRDADRLARDLALEQEKNRLLEAEKKKLSDELAALRRHLAEVEAERDALRKKLHRLRPGPRPLRGWVTAVWMRRRLVYVNVGSRDGVEKGQRFRLLRGDVRVAEVEVQETYESQSVCRVTELVEGVTLAVGDKAVAVHGKAGEEEDVEPQGRLLRADAENGFVYVNLGWSRGVKPGMEFRVLRPQPDGSYTLAGTIRVVRTEKDFSQCSILSTASAEAPLRAGDRVYGADLAAEPETHTVVLLGTFRRDTHGYTRSELVLLLRGAGHHVFESVDDRTSYAVVGDGATTDPRWPDVLRLRVKRVTVDGLLRALDLSRGK